MRFAARRSCLVLALAWLVAGPTPVVRGEDPVRSPAADALLDAAREQVAAGALEKADELLGAAVARARTDGAAASEADAWEGRVEVAERRGDARALRDAAERVGDLAKRRGDGHGFQVARLRVASAHASLGDLDRALHVLDQAGAWFREREDTLGLANVLVAQAVVHTFRADWASALPRATAGLEAFEGLGIREGIAYALGVLAEVQTRTGDLERALETNERALDLLAEDEIGDRANAWGREAELLWLLGRAEDAETALGKALAAFETLPDADGACAARLLLGQIALGRWDGEPDRREHHAEAARRFLEGALRQPGARESLAAEAGARLGDLATRLGDLGEARRRFAEAASVAEAVGDRQLQWTVARGLARVHRAAGDLGAAAREIRRAARLVNEMSDGLADGEQVTLRASEYYETYEEGIGIALDAGDAALLVEFIELERAGSLLDSLGGRRAMRGVGTPAHLVEVERAARAQEAARQRELEEARRRGLWGRDLKPWRDAHRAAEARTDAVVRKIQRAARNAADVVYPVAASLPELEASLAVDEALVLYALRDGADARAVVLTTDGVRVLPLGPTSAIEAACERLREEARGGRPTRGALESLAALLLEPLGLGEGVRTLLVSPHRSLAFVPFPALAALGAGPHRSVALVPSGSTYRVLAEERHATGSGVLALGDPAYPTPGPASGEKSTFRGPRHDPLPATREEVLAITREGDVPLLGPEATEGHLAAALGRRARWRAVHFACHGYVDPERPALSRLALTPGAGSDGYLMTREIFGTRIPADLVVLSACESGLGRIERGEGIVGLVRAFFLAGSPRVVASLWKVEDEATRTLMVAFYEDLRKGRSAAEALMAAQARVRQDPRFADPSYWAAWVLWGVPD